MESLETGEDTVNRLIEHCHGNPQAAEDLFTALVAERRCRVHLAGEEVMLNTEELAEFAARFSAEVAPVLWTSKRRKDQI